ncbi:MAG: C25 family cysteine peptidase, partial [Candidatus Hydrothermia bacterium]
MLGAILNLIVAVTLSQGLTIEKPRAYISSSSYAGITVTYNFTSFGYDFYEIDGKRFVKLNTEEIGVLQELGKPELPAWRDFIEVPYGADVNIKIVSVKTEKVSLSERGIDYKLKPTFPPVPKIQGAKPEFVVDEKTYSQDEFYPTSFAEVKYAGLMRGHNLYTIDVYPIRYNPVRNELEIVTEITAEVTFSGGNVGETIRTLERYFSPYFDYGISGKILNYGTFVSMKGNPALPVVYLVVTPAEWVDSLQDLIRWNREKGYDVKVATIPGTIPSGDTISVRNYLQNAYQNWSTPPTFVVLVGDVDRIDYFRSTEADNPANDLKYEDLDANEGEYWPDVYLGRLSVANIGELGNVVRKTVRYEKVLWSQGTEWAKKAFFIASADPNYHGIGENTHNYAMSRVRAHGMDADSVFAFYTSGSPAIITNAINGGRSLVTYSGHGSETGWSDYNGLNFYNSNVYALSNTDKYVFVQTYACLSGKYSNPECFSEAWIRAGNKGAVASMASSVTSYWYEDDIFERRVFDELFDTGYVWIKGAINEGKIELYRHYSGGGRTKRYFQMYNLMGDPSVYVWTQEPKPLAINYPSMVPARPSQAQITVTLSPSSTPVEGALVSARQKGTTVDTVFDVEYTNSVGIALMDVAPETPDTVFFTVTGYNLWPQTVYAMVSTEGPYVTYKQSYLQEISGNGNGRINPGEDLKLYVMLKNYGQDAATNVNATLTTTNSHITITDNSANYGTIDPYDSTYGSEWFEFTVDYA